MAARKYQDPTVVAGLEAEAAKILKRLGFPAQEAVASPQTNLNKIIACLTRRLSKIDEATQELRDFKRHRIEKAQDENKDPAQATTTIDKSFGKRKQRHTCAWECSNFQIHNARI